MKDIKTQHLSEDQVTWALIGPSELPEAIKDHLSQCEICSQKVKNLDKALSKISEVASNFVPNVPPRPIVRRQKARHSFLNFNFGWRLSWLEVALAGMIFVIIGGGLFAFQYRHSKQIAAMREEIRRDATLMAEVDQLIENPLPPLYEEMEGDIPVSVDKDFMDFIVPDVGGVEENAESA